MLKMPKYAKKILGRFFIGLAASCNAKAKQYYIEKDLKFSGFLPQHISTYFNKLSP